MGRILPKLRPEVRIETQGAGEKLVVELSLPGGRPKRMNGSVWGAVALLDAHDDVASWKRAARERDPALTEQKLDKILDALEQNGLAAAGAPPRVPSPSPPPPAPPATMSVSAPPRAPSRPVAQPDDDEPAPEVSDLVERSMPQARPSFSKEITQVAQVPLRPPMVRRDLRAQRTDKPGQVRVSLPDGGSYDMPEREYRILLELDGIRDLRTVHAAMAAKGAPFSFEQLAMFVSSMTRQGLVVDDARAIVEQAQPSAQPPPPGGALAKGRQLLATGAWALAEEELSNFLTTNPGHPAAQEMLARARQELLGAFPVEGTPSTGAQAAAPPGDVADDATAAVDAAVDAAAELPAPPADAPVDGAESPWDAADAVVASPEAKKRRWLRRLKQLGRVAAIPAALILVSSIVRYPLTITYECEIEPLESRTVRSPIEGAVAAIDVEEGARVTKDQVLGHLENAALELDLVKNKAALERATAELELLKQGSRKEELDRAQARINGLLNQTGIAQARLSRVRGLVRQGVAPREEQDKAAADVAAIQGQLQQARADMNVLKAGARPDDIKKKESEIDSLKAQVDLSEKQLAATVLKAPMAGVITTQKPKDKINTRVSVGDPILEIMSPEKMRATVLVSERDFDVLKKGLPMKVKVSAYPVDEFTGKVIRIAEKVEARENGNIIRTEGVIDNTAGKLVPHMTGFAEIKGDSRPIIALLARRVLRWVRVRFLI